VAERDPLREGPVVGDVGVGQHLDQPLPAGVGDAVDLLAPAAAAAAARGPPLGPEGSELAG
jgi:hypothetical protein